MTLKDRCQAGEAKLEHVSNALLDPRPEILEHCETDLQEVMTLLEGLLESDLADPAAGVVPSDRLADKRALLRLRNRIRLLDIQAQQAGNLCQGWAQLGLSAGYTDQGRPALPPSEPQASYEV